MGQLDFDPDRIDEQYRRRLCSLVEREMNIRYRRREDAEDVVQSVFRTFFRRASQGEYELENFEALWGLLRYIARQKIVKHVKYHKAAKRNPDRESDSDVVAVRQPHPSEAEAHLLRDVLDTVLEGSKTPEAYVYSLQLNGYTISEIVAITLQGLKEPYPRIFGMRLQGLTYAEIAKELDLTVEQVRHRSNRFISRLRVLLK